MRPSRSSSVACLVAALAVTSTAAAQTAAPAKPFEFDSTTIAGFR